MTTLHIRAAALALAGSLASPAHAADAVRFEVDDQARQVIVHARLTFWRFDAPAPSPAEVAAIVEAMKRGWEGQPILCYKLAIDIQADSVARYQDIPADSVGLWLYNLPYDKAAGTPGWHHKRYPYTRSYIGSYANQAATPCGDDAINRQTPELGAKYPFKPEWWNRVWSADPRPMTLSHEFGHIIGLHDYYDHKHTGTLLPGCVEDAMFNNGVTGAGRYFPETITKLVRRGGVDPSKLQCSRHLESTPVAVDLHAPSGELGLRDVQIVADNCEWLPPSSDPKYTAQKNQWKGTFKYTPHMATAEQLHGFEIHPVFKSEGTVEKPVAFETFSWRDRSGGKERWRDWESVTLYDDIDITARAELRLRTMDQPLAVENYSINAHMGGKAGTGTFGYQNNQPITVEIRGACK